MSTQDIAHDLVELCKAGKFDEAGEKYWAEDVLSVEPMGENAEARGKAAVRAKGEDWSNKNTANSIRVDGPYVAGDEFVVRFTMDVIQKDNGERHTMDEVGLYRVRDGKIAEERFFYAR
jgi:ketosteroid isomerase-like protein